MTPSPSLNKKKCTRTAGCHKQRSFIHQKKFKWHKQTKKTISKKVLFIMYCYLCPGVNDVKTSENVAQSVMVIMNMCIHSSHWNRSQRALPVPVKLILGQREPLLHWLSHGDYLSVILTGSDGQPPPVHKANVVSIFCTVPPNIISVFRFYFIVASCDVFCIKVLVHISNLNTVKSDYLSDVRSFF